MSLDHRIVITRQKNLVVIIIDGQSFTLTEEVARHVGDELYKAGCRTYQEDN